MVTAEESKLNKYKQYIEDIALEISQSNCWRKILFDSEYNKKFLISSASPYEIPSYVKSIIDEGFEFYVSKVITCPEKFDDGSVIFKFEAIDYPNIVKYSGN